MKWKSLVTCLTGLLGIFLMAANLHASTAWLTTNHSLTLAVNNEVGTNRLWYAEILGAAANDALLLYHFEDHNDSQIVDTSNGPSSYSPTVSVTHYGNFLSYMHAETSVVETPLTMKQNLEGKGVAPTYVEGSWRPGYTKEIAYNQLLVTFYGTGSFDILLSDTYTFNYGFDNSEGNPFGQVVFNNSLELWLDRPIGGWNGQSLFYFLDTEVSKSIADTAILIITGEFTGPGDWHTLGIDLRSEFIGETAIPSGPPVPLPSTALLFGSGILGLGAWRRFWKS